MDNEKERVVFVEFSSVDGTPMIAETHETHANGVTSHDYGFEISKKWGLLSHYLGMGPVSPVELHQSFLNQEPVESVYWASPEVEIKEVSSMCVRLDALPESYTPEKLFNTLDVIECESGMVYCSVCDDWMPDYSPDYCEHIWPCRKCDIVSTPDERCTCTFEEED